MKTLDVKIGGSKKLLLVDDDPIFCKAVRRKAEELKLDLTVCKTVGEVTKLSNRTDFDVAILDYFFGQELTAFQVSHLLDREVPVVLVSNTEGRKLSGDHWPAEIRTFVNKSAGIDAILAEAFLVAHWGSFASGAFVPLTSKIVAPRFASLEDFGWPLMVAIAAAFSLFYFTTAV